MIPTVHKRGCNVRGLLAYLYGPGRHEEHRNPHLIAVWTGPNQLPWLEPPCGPTGRHDVTRLARLLNQPVNAAANPPALTVWHTSIRNHHSDRPLTDKRWAHIAREMMNAVGLAPHGDRNAVRWAAIRHAEDHIHLVATLVRQDGATAWGWNEKYKAQAAARRLERELGLYRVGPADHTAHRRPGAVEQNKTRRLGQREVPRDRLRREVRAAAAAAAVEGEFFRRLIAAGVLVRLRHSTVNPDEVTGYSVGLQSHRTPNGETIWYGGGRLAPDLTLPRLRRRWGRPTPNRPGIQGRRLNQAREAIHAANRQAAAWTDDPDRAAAIAIHVSDLLTALSRLTNRREMGGVCDLLDHAARARSRDRTPYTLAGANLRSAARLLASVHRLDITRETRTLLDLLAAIALFADTLADLRRAQRRLHQARAAQAAAVELRALTARLPSPIWQPVLPFVVDGPTADGTARSKPRHQPLRR